MSRRLVVLDVVGLTPRLLAHMPRLRAVAEQGFSAELGTVLPAVTCSAQATLLTGEPPAGHGIVGNGWYFRDLGEVLLWRQHHALVGGEKVWQAARRVEPGYTVANVCWWYAMGADVNWTVTPRPIYYADGRKEPDCWTDPPELHDTLTDALGTFPLFTYWGPGAGLPSSRWICQAAERILADQAPDLTLVYVPHLDYDLQRFGPSSPRAAAAAAELDAVLAPLLDAARAADATVVALSEYGITDVSRPVDVNRLLRAEGLLRVYTQDGMEYLDPWTSRAFAVADHQIAHVYVKDPADVAAVAKLCAGLPGVAEVLDAEGKAAAGLDHERAGELVLVAEPDSWFTYYYWLDDDRAPDFARNVEIHRKPGYDPAELFFDPAGPGAAKRRAGVALARKKLGMRYLMSVVGLDAGARAVRGSHGRLPADPADGPVLLCSDPSAARDSFAATEVKALLLDLAGLVPATAPTGAEPAAGAVPTAAAGGTPTGSAAGGPSSAPSGPPGTGERR
ncbi:Predicted pyrophosphatase or phosphodiesterase, AlkP superfamily [Micromonospora matsumotoense]|uniref:Predicted pyrophosphatase or phosphodiesterase, AlkP superfamily n=1 Tax=Micromonospora matsumotoense TaxID=121616 RepID=A0A1C4UNQ1_9ACTN|nr:nucleotide pyrophosphatase/phosphodiesterase family protein [Micromonospora matsumotoense]SCE73308.1 Predicted pyrophosphatase or phosphodiesterase, AlkP superfamily [Micromonospora matsumotoense]